MREEPKADTGERAERDLGSCQSGEAKAAAQGQHHEDAADAAEPGLESHALIAKIHPTQNRFRHSGQRSDDEAQDEQAGRDRHHLPQFGADLRDQRREPDQYGSDDDDKWQEDEPDHERASHRSAIPRGVVERLPRRDDQAQRLRGTRISGRHVADQPAEHLPHAIERAAQSCDEHWRHDKADEQFAAVVEECLNGIQRGPPRERRSRRRGLRGRRAGVRLEHLSAHTRFAHVAAGRARSARGRPTRPSRCSRGGRRVDRRGPGDRR